MPATLPACGYDIVNRSPRPLEAKLARAKPLICLDSVDFPVGEPRFDQKAFAALPGLLDTAPILARRWR